MAEMLETTAILTEATPRSFVIIDGIGHRTAPEDGTAMSFACLHHLHYHNWCRMLFATNFHALADMTRDFEALGRYYADIKETPSDSFYFVYRLRKGINCKPHALKVAHLAGLPLKTIELARRVQDRLKGRADSKEDSWAKMEESMPFRILCHPLPTCRNILQGAYWSFFILFWPLSSFTRKDYRRGLAPQEPIGTRDCRISVGLESINHGLS